MSAAAIDEEEAGRKGRETPPARGVMDVTETKKEADRSVEMLEQDGAEQEGAEHGLWLATFNGFKAFRKFLQNQRFDFRIVLLQAIRFSNFSLSS